MWLNVASLEDLKEKKMLRVEHEGIAFLLTFYEGKVYAMNDKCPHMGSSLVKGSLEKGVVTCASHHVQIDITNGEIVEKAKILLFRVPVKKAQTYPTKIEGKKVFIEL